jgi:predicted Zn-dependent protease
LESTVSHRWRILFGLVLAMGLLATVSLAQKPSAPPPTPAPPPSTGAGHPTTTPSPMIAPPNQPDIDLVMFILGRVTTSDGTPIPNDMVVERVCNNKVRQQVYASTRGDFSMQLGSRNDSFVDATADYTSSQDQNAARNGIPRRELANCDLRASASGFRSNSIGLVALTPSSGTVDIGPIVVQRTSKIEGVTLSAKPYQAPKNARKAYEQGLGAERKGKLADAHQYFEKAVELYPKYTSAWYQLGIVRQKEKQNDAARTAYLKATTLDTRFVPPYLSLASMAYQAKDWLEVLAFTDHILELDPLNHTIVTDYIVDLDPLNYADAYFYNAIANYNLGKFEAAEKSAHMAEHVDLRTSFPQLHLLLAELSARKDDYGTAIAELYTYLELVPHSQYNNQVQEKLARYKELNTAQSNNKKIDQN